MKYISRVCFLLTFILVGVFFVPNFALAQGAPLLGGNVKVLNVSGDVWFYASNDNGGKPVRLQPSSFLKQGAKLVTSPSAQVILLFDNGSLVEVKGQTKIAVDEYLVSPFESGTVDYRSLKSEPTLSKTRLSVLNGTIVCKVPKLSQDSYYSVKTPLGYGEVKGTVLAVNVTEEVSTFVVTEGKVLVSKGAESYYVHGGQSQQEGVAQANVENAVAISNDPNARVPQSLLNQLSQAASSFSNSVGQMVSPNAMEGSPQQSSAPESQSQQADTNSGTDVSGPDNSSGGVAPLAPFSGGGGGGGGGSGGGGIYAN